MIIGLSLTVNQQHFRIEQDNQQPHQIAVRFKDNRARLKGAGQNIIAYS